MGNEQMKQHEGFESEISNSEKSFGGSRGSLDRAARKHRTIKITKSRSMSGRIPHAKRPVRRNSSMKGSAKLASSSSSCSSSVIDEEYGHSDDHQDVNFASQDLDSRRFKLKNNGHLPSSLKQADINSQTEISSSRDSGLSTEDARDASPNNPWRLLEDTEFTQQGMEKPSETDHMSNAQHSGVSNITTAGMKCPVGGLAAESFINPMSLSDFVSWLEDKNQPLDSIQTAIANKPEPLHNGSDLKPWSRDLDPFSEEQEEEIEKLAALEEDPSGGDFTEMLPKDVTLQRKDDDSDDDDEGSIFSLEDIPSSDEQGSDAETHFDEDAKTYQNTNSEAVCTEDSFRIDSTNTHETYLGNFKLHSDVLENSDGIEIKKQITDMTPYMTEQTLPVCNAPGQEVKCNNNRVNSSGRADVNCASVDPQSFYSDGVQHTKAFEECVGESGFVETKISTDHSGATTWHGPINSAVFNVVDTPSRHGLNCLTAHEMGNEGSIEFAGVEEKMRENKSSQGEDITANVVTHCDEIADSGVPGAKIEYERSKKKEAQNESELGNNMPSSSELHVVTEQNSCDAALKYKMGAEQSSNNKSEERPGGRNRSQIESNDEFSSSGRSISQINNKDFDTAVMEGKMTDKEHAGSSATVSTLSSPNNSSGKGDAVSDTADKSAFLTSLKEGPGVQLADDNTSSAQELMGKGDSYENTVSRSKPGNYVEHAQREVPQCSDSALQCYNWSVKDNSQLYSLVFKEQYELTAQLGGIHGLRASHVQNQKQEMNVNSGPFDSSRDVALDHDFKPCFHNDLPSLDSSMAYVSAVSQSPNLNEREDVSDVCRENLEDNKEIMMSELESGLVQYDNSSKFTSEEITKDVQLLLQDLCSQVLLTGEGTTDITGNAGVSQCSDNGETMSETDERGSQTDVLVYLTDTTDESSENKIVEGGDAVNVEETEAIYTHMVQGNKKNVNKDLSLNEVEANTADQTPSCGDGRLIIDIHGISELEQAEEAPGLWQINADNRDQSNFNNIGVKENIVMGNQPPGKAKSGKSSKVSKNHSVMNEGGTADNSLDVKSEESAEDTADEQAIRIDAGIVVASDPHVPQPKIQSEMLLGSDTTYPHSAAVETDISAVPDIKKQNIAISGTHDSDALNGQSEANQAEPKEQRETDNENFHASETSVDSSMQTASQPSQHGDGETGVMLETNGQRDENKELVSEDMPTSPPENSRQGSVEDEQSSDNRNNDHDRRFSEELSAYAENLVSDIIDTQVQFLLSEAATLADLKSSSDEISGINASSVEYAGDVPFSSYQSTTENGSQRSLEHQSGEEDIREIAAKDYAEVEVDHDASAPGNDCEEMPSDLLTQKSGSLGFVSVPEGILSSELQTEESSANISEEICGSECDGDDHVKEGSVHAEEDNHEQTTAYKNEGMGIEASDALAAKGPLDHDLVSTPSCPTANVSETEAVVTYHAHDKVDKSDSEVGEEFDLSDINSDDEAAEEGNRNVAGNSGENYVESSEIASDVEEKEETSKSELTGVRVYEETDSTEDAISLETEVLDKRTIESKDNNSTALSEVRPGDLEDKSIENNELVSEQSHTASTPGPSSEEMISIPVSEKSDTDTHVRNIENIEEELNKIADSMGNTIDKEAETVGQTMDDQTDDNKDSVDPNIGLKTTGSVDEQALQEESSKGNDLLELSDKQSDGLGDEIDPALDANEEVQTPDESEKIPSSQSLEDTEVVREKLLAAKGEKLLKRKQQMEKESLKWKLPNDEETATSYGGLSTSISLLSRRSSDDSTSGSEPSLRELKDALAEMEEKYRQAMVQNAQLDNERTQLNYRVEQLKDSIEEQEDELYRVKKEYKEKCQELERDKRMHHALLKKHEDLQEALRQRDELIQEQGLVMVGGNGVVDGESDDEDRFDGRRPYALVTPEAAEVLESAGDGSLDIRLKHLAEEKRDLHDQIRRLKSELEEERKNKDSAVNNNTGSLAENGVADMQLLEIQREASKQISEYKFKLQKAEQEIGSFQANVMRLETQLQRYKATSEVLEKSEDEMRAEKRKLQRDLRASLDRIEEMEMTNAHLEKRLERMRASRSAQANQT